MKAHALLLAATVAGCALHDAGDHTWHKEGATPRERDAALAAAEVQARQAGGDEATQRGIVVANMTGLGWRLVPKSSVRR